MFELFSTKNPEIIEKVKALNLKLQETEEGSKRGYAQSNTEGILISDEEFAKTLDVIRSFPRPIVVDFNNVLANNGGPDGLKLNPDAPRFVAELRKIGTVFIVTAASRWKGLHDFMVREKIWSDDMILMTAGTWLFLTQHDELNPRGIALRKEFVSYARSLGWEISKKDLIRPPARKQVASLFKKPFKIPIIDDSFLATDNNPGMLGIQVQAWEPDYPKSVDPDNKNLPSLQDAAALVKKHYETDGKIYSS